MGIDSYIVLGFSNIAIIDTPGPDFYIFEFSFHDEYANVYVSNDNKEFVFLKKIIKTNRGLIPLDLSDIKYNKPVRFVKIESLTNIGRSVGFDLAYLQVDETSIRLPYRSYYVNSKDNISLIFENDCSLSSSCNVYCTLNYNWFSTITSCKLGCKSYDLYDTCLCNMVEYDILNNTTPYIVNNFNSNRCSHGCFYRLGQKYHPEYSFVSNKFVRQKNIIKTIDICYTFKCVESMREYCNSNIDCNGFALDVDFKIGYIFSNTNNKYYYLRNIMMFIKNDKETGTIIITTPGVITTPMFTTTIGNTSSSTDTPSPFTTLFPNTPTTPTTPSTTSSTPKSSSTTSSTPKSSSTTSSTQTNPTTSASDNLNDDKSSDTTNSSSASSSNKSNNSGTILMAVLIPIVIILLGMVAFYIYRKYYYVDGSDYDGDNHNLVSFENPMFNNPKDMDMNAEFDNANNKSYYENSYNERETMA